MRESNTTLRACLLDDADDAVVRYNVCGVSRNENCWCVCVCVWKKGNAN